jgi:hypothetical protein
MAPLERCSGTYYPVECASLEKAETYQKAVQGCHMHHRIHIRNLLKIVYYKSNLFLPSPLDKDFSAFPGPIVFGILNQFLV